MQTVTEQSPLIPIVDARGLACPQPVLLARASLVQQASGGRIQLLSTDPMSRIDVAAFCARGGHHLLSTVCEHGCWRFEIERG